MVPTTGLVMAETISRAKPVYPEQAKDQKITGIVELEADINERGEVIRAKAVSGPDQLRGAAEEALMKWKFKPASLNGVNIASKARISMVFNLR
jgi:TonB family protein